MEATAATGSAAGLVWAAGACVNRPIVCVAWEDSSSEDDLLLLPRHRAQPRCPGPPTQWVLVGSAERTAQRAPPPRSAPLLGCCSSEDSLSSANAEDLRHPGALRAGIKQAHSAALDLSEALRAMKLSDDRERSPVRGRAPALSSRMQALRLTGPPFSCSICGHSFALKKTREMHKKRCTG